MIAVTKNTFRHDLAVYDRVPGPYNEIFLNYSYENKVIMLWE